MTDPSPDDIRRALDVLTVPDLMSEIGRRIVKEPRALDEGGSGNLPPAALAEPLPLVAPSVPVTKDTPPGTVITCDGWHGPDPTLLWTNSADAGESFITVLAADAQQTQAWATLSMALRAKEQTDD